MSVEEEEEDDNGVRLIDFLCYIYLYVMVYNLILKFYHNRVTEDGLDRCIFAFS